MKDINVDSESSSPSGLVEAGGSLYFSAWIRETGGEVWKSDGTLAGTSRVSDVLPDRPSSFVRNIIPADGKIFFSAGDFNQPTSLWVTDGTPGGTREVKDVEVSFGRGVAVGDKLFFQASTSGDAGPLGSELWVSDGTDAGTHLVKDINPGQAGSDPLDFGFSYHGTLFFRATSGAESGLWRSDGTEGGTYRVSPVIPAGSVSILSPSWVVGPGDVVYFSGRDATHGNELWRTDGTAAGTFLVKDLEPGTASSGAWGPSGLSVLDGSLYFRTTNASGTTLWKSDGTESGTQPVRALDASQEATHSAILRPRAGGPGLFLAGKTLWRTDGTAAGTAAVLTHPFDWAGEATVSGGWLYYTVINVENGSLHQELWRSDGTTAGTRKVPVRMPPPPSYADPRTPLIDYRGALYFSGAVADTELLRLAPDQTVPETIDVNPARPYSSSPENFFTAGDHVYFLTRPYGYGTYKLWSTDGTEGGTVQVFDTGYDPYMGGIPNWGPAAFGNSIVFSMGPQVWMAGPTPGSQRLVANLAAETNGMATPVVVGNKIFFSSYEQADFDRGVYKKRLWVSNGGAPATPIRNGAGGVEFTVGHAATMVAAGNTLYFPGQDVDGNVELWRSDGTAAGTRRVKEINPGAGGNDGSWPESLTNVNGTVYFVAREASPDPRGFAVQRLFKTDGTDVGTVRVSDTVRVTNLASSLPYPGRLPFIGDTIFFNASDDADPNTWGLWRSDGTSAGTRRVSGAIPAGLSVPSDASPSVWAVVGSRLFFVGWEAGNKLYVTDGTESGTRMLADSLSYSVTNYASGPYELTAVGDLLYFVANDGVRGAELWRSDGTPGGTVIVEDLNPGPGAHGVYDQFAFNGMTLATLAPLGDSVLFSGTDGKRGVEVWKARYDGEPTADAGSGYHAAERDVITLSAAGSRPGAGGPIVSYEWDLDFDGTFVPTATGQLVAYTAGDGPRTAHVAVRVTDASGKSHVDMANVVLSDRPPTLSVTGDAATTEGAPYALHLAVVDSPGSDQVSTWWVDWGDGTAAQNVKGNTDGSPLTVTHVYADGPAECPITVTAIDDDGSVSMAGMRVGILDASFGAAGIVTNPVRADRVVAVQPDGRIVTAGGTGQFLLSRYLADGSPDASFGDGGNLVLPLAGVGGRAQALLVQPDGRIVLAATRVEGDDADWLVVRLTAEGSPDASFGDGGVVALEMESGVAAEAADLAPQPDGKIVVVGSVDEGAAAGGVNFAAVRLNVDGSPDASFGAGGDGTVTASFGDADHAHAVAIQTDGRVVVAGTANDTGLSATIALVRYTPSGDLDPTFGTGGKAAPRRGTWPEQAFDLALQPDGRLVTAGSAFGPERPVVARYNPDGSADTGFGQNGLAYWNGGVGAFHGVAVEPGGNIVAAAPNGLALARLTVQGWADYRFGIGYPDYGISRFDYGLPPGQYQANALALQPDGNIVAVGSGPQGAILVRAGGEAPSFRVSVANVPPAGASAGPDRTALEGQRVSFTGSFTDPAVTERRTYRWRVTASNGQAVADGTAVAFDFVPADEGTYTVEFTVADESGRSSTGVAVLTVANAPPSVNAGPDRTGVEGQEVAFTVPAPTDPGGADTVALAWSVTAPGGTTFAEGTGNTVHFTPGDDGVYTVSVTGTDNDGGSATATSRVSVADAPPRLTLVGNGGAFVGEEYVLRLAADDPSPADTVRAWTVDWGDGTSSAYGPGDTALARHAYATPARYAIVASATDDDGTFTQSAFVNVAPDTVLSDGVLTVTGTALADVVNLGGEPGGDLILFVNGAARTYAAGSVRRLVINLLAGNDSLEIVGSVPETSADLGDGNDNVIDRGTAAGQGLSVVGGAGTDTFGAAVGSGGVASFDGGTGFIDAVVYDGTAGNDTINTSPTSMTSPAGVSVSFTNVEYLTANGLGGDDTLTMGDTTNNLVQVKLNGGDGNDTFLVGDAARLNQWSTVVTVTLDAGPGEDSVTYNEQGYTAPGASRQYMLATDRMVRGFLPILHYGFEQVTLNTSDLADAVAVNQRKTPRGGSPAFVVNAGGPDASGSTFDTLNFTADPTAFGGELTSLEAGAGRYTFANMPPVSFTGVERVTGPTYVPTRVVGRFVFYNNSAFDGGNPAADAADDNAIAGDKSALLPGQPARFANLTSYTPGINGVMIDVAGLPATAKIDASDFDFRAGAAGDPANWPVVLTAPTSVTLRRGAGAGGSDRVTIVWPNGTLVNQWLRVTLKATAHTDLQQPDVFFFGNLVGETGDRTTPLRVSASDLAAVRRGYATAGGAAALVTSALDFNRDGKVNALDLAVVRSRLGRAPLATGIAATPVAAPPAPLFSDTTLKDNTLLA